MLEKLFLRSRKKAFFTRTVILLLLTALPVSLLSGPLSLSASAGEITEEFSDEYSDGSGDRNGDGFAYEFEEEGGGVSVDFEGESGDEVSADSGNESSEELPAGFEEETADEAAYGTADGAVESGALTSTAEEVTAGSTEDVAGLAAYLAGLLEDFHTTDGASAYGGFPWDSENKQRSWTYYNGIMMDAYMMLDADDYFYKVASFYQANIDGSGKVNNRPASDNYYRENELDSIPPTRALFDLLRLSKEDGAASRITYDQKIRFERMIDYVYDLLRRHTTVGGTNGNFMHKMNNAGWATYQIALDGLYMAQPFFMELANALEDGTLQNYPDGFTYYTGTAIDPDSIYSAVVSRMAWIADNLYDGNTHLYNHGWGPDAGVNGQYWLRAVGWYAAALADVISMLPEDRCSREKEILIEYEKRLFDGMMEYQDPDTGMWYNVINYGPELTSGSGNGLESSGSALMAYAMMKSYVEGYVGDEYGEAGLRAFNGTVGNYLIAGSDGSYTLQNVYISSGVATTPEGYLDKDYVDNEAKGVGPLIMASTWAGEAARIHNHPTAYEISGNGDITLPLNEVPDFSGIELKLTFENPRDENGTERIICSDQLTFGEFDPARPGPQEVGIFYNDVPYGTVNVIFEEVPEFISHSLVLSGEIGVNFFLTLPGDADDYEGSYVTFTCNGVDHDPVEPDPGFMNSSGTGYGFTCYVNSLQMAEEITAVFHYGEDLDKTVEDRYSVLEYLNYIVEHPDAFGSDSESLVELARSINDYGFYAQQYLSRVHGFDVGEEGRYAAVPGAYNVLTDADFQEAAEGLKDYKCQFEEDEGGADLPVSGLTYSLILDARTEINIYLRLNEGVADEVRYEILSSDGNTIIEEEDLLSPEDGDRYIIPIRNISAHMLGDQFKVKINIGETERVLIISALSYAGAVLNYSQEEDAKAAVCALFNYYKRTMDYRGY